jgi:hypothetical protein
MRQFYADLENHLQMSENIAEQPYFSALQRAQKKTQSWRLLYRTWYAVHYSIGILGVVAAAVGATATATEHPLHNYSWAFGVFAAVCTSLITFLGPVQKAERYWKAFYRADQALLAYDAKQIDIKELVQEIGHSREIIISGAELRSSS